MTARRFLINFVFLFFTPSLTKSSHSERSKSCQLRSDAESLINAVATSVWDCWSNTNNAFNNRSSEMLEAKSKMQLHLHKVTYHASPSECSTGGFDRPRVSMTIITILQYNIFLNLRSWKSEIFIIEFGA